MKGQIYRTTVAGTGILLPVCIIGSKLRWKELILYMSFQLISCFNLSLTETAHVKEFGRSKYIGTHVIARKLEGAREMSLRGELFAAGRKGIHIARSEVDDV